MIRSLISNRTAATRKTYITYVRTHEPPLCAHTPRPSTRPKNVFVDSIPSPNQYNPTVTQFKAQIFERGGVSGLRRLREHLEGMDPTGSGLLERSQLVQGLINFGIDADDGPGGDIEKIMGFFDRDVVGSIIIQEFHRGLRVRF